MSDESASDQQAKPCGNVNRDLPNVLILGDSISLGYTPFVVANLAGKANVWRPETNCGSTLVYLEHLDEWLGDREWDVVHFNCGLHDINRKNNEAIGGVEGKRRVSLDEYAANLAGIADRIKSSAKIAIWASTTPVPSEAASRNPGDEIEYNAGAERLMRDRNIEINDLHAFISPFTPECHPSLNNVHYTEEGYGKLGDEVAAVILNAVC